MPKVKEDTRDRLARTNVDELDVDVHVHTRLPLSKIPTHKLSLDVYKILSVFSSNTYEDDSQ